MVSDKRKKNFFQIDNIFLDEFSRIFPPAATIVYMWLCRFADKDGESFPSLTALAEYTGMNEKTIRRNIELLEEHNIIAKKRFGRTKNNRYYLVDKTEWRKKEEPKQEEVIGQNVQSGDRTLCPVEKQSDWTFCPPVIGHFDHSKRSQMSNHSNKTQLTIPRYTNTVTNVTVQPEAADSENIQEVFNIFYEVNPTINFANITQRKAAKYLVDKLGLEKTINSAKAAIACLDQPYAPKITNPLELKEKLARLVAFYETQKTTLAKNSYALQTTNPDL